MFGALNPSAQGCLHPVDCAAKDLLGEAVPVCCQVVLLSEAVPVVCPQSTAVQAAAGVHGRVDVGAGHRHLKIIWKI